MEWGGSITIYLLVPDPSKDPLNVVLGHTEVDPQAEDNCLDSPPHRRYTCVYVQKLQSEV